MELELVKFIKNNPDWEQSLAEAPYYITIKRKNNFIMFNYSQIDSDFFNPIVKECRGIILEDITFKPVCIPFFKFGNYGEGYADNIDWDSACVQEKVDGSLIKVWNYNNEWHVSTNGTIDANDADLYTDVCESKTYYELFMIAAENSNLNIDKLDKDYTWMFELISPFNRVVVPYSDTELRHIGTRNINTYEECNIDIGVKKPKIYEFKSLDECIEIAKDLPFNEEGYVVVDKYWHRNKVKSPAYVAVHHLKNNGVVTYSRIVSLIRKNEHEEFLVYYPEFKEVFDKVINSINLFINDANQDISDIISKCFPNRRDLAEHVKNTKCPALIFNWVDKYAKQWLWNQTDDKIVKWIGIDK